jgi:hypothetical protein
VTASRPATVTWGTACLGVSLMIGVAILYFAWRTPGIALFCLVLVGSLTFLALRRGWPRWVITIMAVASLVLTFPLVQFQLTFGTVIPIATGVQLALELAGCVLLFLPASSRWYRRPRPSPTES